MNKLFFMSLKTFKVSLAIKCFFEGATVRNKKSETKNKKAFQSNV